RWAQESSPARGVGWTPGDAGTDEEDGSTAPGFLSPANPCDHEMGPRIGSPNLKKPGNFPMRKGFLRSLAVVLVGNSLAMAQSWGSPAQQPLAPTANPGMSPPPSMVWGPALNDLPDTPPANPPTKPAKGSKRAKKAADVAPVYAGPGDPRIVATPQGEAPV